MPNKTLILITLALALATLPGLALAGGSSLGAHLLELTPELATHFGADGVLVSRVEPGSAAERAGLRAGDVLVRLGADDTHSLAATRRALRQREPGDEISLDVVRDGSPVELAVVLDGRDRWLERSHYRHRHVDVDWDEEEFEEAMEELGEEIGEIGELVGHSIEIAFDSIDWDHLWDDGIEEAIEHSLEASLAVLQDLDPILEVELEHLGRDIEREIEREMRHLERELERVERQLERRSRRHYR